MDVDRRAITVGAARSRSCSRPCTPRPRTGPGPRRGWPLQRGAELRRASCSRRQPWWCSFGALLPPPACESACEDSARCVCAGAKRQHDGATVPVPWLMALMVSAGTVALASWQKKLFAVEGANANNPSCRSPQPPCLTAIQIRSAGSAGCGPARPAPGAGCAGLRPEPHAPGVGCCTRHWPFKCYLGRGCGPCGCGGVSLWQPGQCCGAAAGRLLSPVRSDCQVSPCPCQRRCSRFRRQGLPSSDVEHTAISRDTRGDVPRACCLGGYRRSVPAVLCVSVLGLAPLHRAPDHAPACCVPPCYCHCLHYHPS